MTSHAIAATGFRPAHRSPGRDALRSFYAGAPAAPVRYGHRPFVMVAVALAVCGPVLGFLTYLGA
ncbi:MAG: hypothetical protein PGN09_06700 [Sphingomonas fennica]